MTPVSAARFRKAFPDFKGTSTVLVEQKLAAAALSVNETVWGDTAEQGQMYLAAHLLSSAPQGEQARLKKENRITTYWLEFERLRRCVTIGIGRVC